MNQAVSPGCTPHDHTPAHSSTLLVDAASVDRCARIFRALGETARLRLIARLAHGALCVGELAALENETVATISQRLRVLRSENIVVRRRDGKHVLYSLADQHMHDLVRNGLAHAAHGAETPHSKQPTAEAPSAPPATEREHTMSTAHLIHDDHNHQHGTGCGHTAIQHNGHTDFLHDGHLHHMHEGHVDEHTLEVSAANPADCTDGHDCAGHDASHTHGEGCGHEAVPHGDHTDYLVDGHLHHPHAGHCDNHGNVQVVQ